MNTTGQFHAILKLHVRTFHTRIRASAIIIVSLVAVVCVLLSLMSVGEGIRVDYLKAGRTDEAIVRIRGASAGQVIAPIAEPLIKDASQAPGVRRTHGIPVVDSELTVIAPLIRRNGETGYTGFLGVGDAAPEAIPGFRLLAGRLPDRKGNELLVGRTAQQKFAGVNIGNFISLYNTRWKVVGVFATDSFTEGNLIFSGPRLVEVLRQNGPPQQIPFYSLIVGLESADSFPAFRNAMESRWRAYDVQRLSDFWQQRWESLPRVMLLFDLVVSCLLSLGALTGTLHVMQANFDQRREEIAVLRAIGYSGEIVAATFVMEAMILALVGAALGTAVDWLWLDGSAYNGAYGVFRVAVDKWMYLIGASWALGIAFIGAIIPAYRTAMIPIAEAISA